MLADRIPLIVLHLIQSVIVEAKCNKVPTPVMIFVSTGGNIVINLKVLHGGEQKLAITVLNWRRELIRQFVRLFLCPRFYLCQNLNLSTSWVTVTCQN